MPNRSMKVAGGRKLIESDTFPFEFISQIAERESWRKEIHRPIYHVHKWFLTRRVCISYARLCCRNTHRARQETNGGLEDP